MSTSIKKQVEAFFKLVGKEEQVATPRTKGSQVTMDKVSLFSSFFSLFPLFSSIFFFLNLILI